MARTSVQRLTVLLASSLLLAPFLYSGCEKASGKQVARRANAKDATSTIHDHVESCWVGTGPQDDRQVDMMAIVVGLNHRLPDGGKHPVELAGVKEMAGAIKQAWPDRPDRIVIMSSSFFPSPGCPTSNGECLQKELGNLYSTTFQLNMVLNDDAGRWGTLGVITGGGWELAFPPGRMLMPSNPAEGVAQVRLRDRDTKAEVTVYTFHAPGGNRTAPEIEDITRLEQSQFPQVGGRLRLPPILGGDFNMTEDAACSDDRPADCPRNANDLFVRGFDWINKDVTCASSPWWKSRVT